MTLPGEYKFGFVVGRFLQMVADTAGDIDPYPDPRPAKGTITFTPHERQRKVSQDFSAFVGHATVGASLGNRGQIIDAEGRDGIWLIEGTHTVRVTNDAGVVVPDFDITVTPDHTIENPLDLVTAAPPQAGPGVTLQTILVPSGAVPGQVLGWTTDGLAWTDPAVAGDVGTDSGWRVIPATPGAGWNEEMQRVLFRYRDGACTLIAMGATGIPGGSPEQRRWMVHGIDTLLDFGWSFPPDETGEEMGIFAFTRGISGTWADNVGLWMGTCRDLYGGIYLSEEPSEFASYQAVLRWDARPGFTPTKWPGEAMIVRQDGDPWAEPPHELDAYQAGELVTFEGQVYRSTADGNVWSPSDNPEFWELVS